MAPFAQRRVPAHTRDPNYVFGRPSLYKPEYCELVVEKMGEGLSLTAFAGLIKVSRETVYHWTEQHKDFSDAVNRARATRVLWWEQKLMRCEKGGEVTASIFALRNADPHEWKEVRNVFHDHNVVVRTMTDEQLLQIAGAGEVIDGHATRVDDGD